MSWLDCYDGSRLWFEEAGNGSPLLLLHGWCHSHSVWRYLAEDLAKKFRVILVDLPGHGASTVGKYGFTLQSASNCVKELVETLQLSNLIVLGWSLGGTVLVEAIPHIMGDCAGMVLSGYTPCFTITSGWEIGHQKSEVAAMAKMMKRNPELTRDRFMGSMFFEGEVYRCENENAICKLLKNIPFPDLKASLQGLEILSTSDQRDAIKKCQIPTLVIQGDEDVICLPKSAQYLFENIPQVMLKTFKDCGHAPFLTDPFEFIRTIEQFSGGLCDNNDR